jgi:hypothetical protein
MSVAAPNQTRLKILAGVLRLETFTVADLCLHTGLGPSMVYRELAELQRERVLESESALADGESAPRHRPPKRYRLSPEPEKRKELERDLASFLPEFEDPKSNRHLKKAQEVLNTLSVDLLDAALERFGDSELDRWEKGQEERLAEASKELRRATWESETDFSEAGSSDHPIMIVTRLSESLEERFLKTLRAERNRRESEAARVTWSDIISSALRAAVPAATLVAAVESGGALLDNVVNLAEVLAELSRMVKKQIEGTRGLRTERLELFLPFVSSLQLDLREVQSDSELLATLAKHWITYGDSATEPLAYIRELVTQSEDYRLLFNEANLAQLAQQPKEAYESWIRYLPKRWSATELENIERPLVACIAANLWSADAYRGAVRIITMECEASVSAFSGAPFEDDEGYAIEPQLYNPVRNKSGRESTFIAIAEPLVQHKRMYVTTTEAERPVVVGVPYLARADLLFQSQMKEEDAWLLAGSVDPTDRIVKIDFFRNATRLARKRAEEILTSSLSAEIIG